MSADPKRHPERLDTKTIDFIAHQAEVEPVAVRDLLDLLERLGRLWKDQ